MSVSDKGGLQVVANITPTCHVQTVDGCVRLFPSLHLFVIVFVAQIEKGKGFQKGIQL